MTFADITNRIQAACESVDYTFILGNMEMFEEKSQNIRTTEKVALFDTTGMASTETQLSSGAIESLYSNCPLRFMQKHSEDDNMAIIDAIYSALKQDLYTIHKELKNYYVNFDVLNLTTRKIQYETANLFCGFITNFQIKTACNR